MMLRRLSRILIAGVALLAPFAAGAIADVTPGPHPLNIEDMLAMDHFGQVVLAQHGNLVLFEKGGPGEGFKDYGLDDPVASSRIYVFDRSKTDAPRRLLANFAFANWIGAVSPDGDRLAVYWREGEMVKAGVVDLVTGKLVKFAFNPSFDFQQSTPLWISDDALVYAAEPAGRPSPRMDFRRQSAEVEQSGQQAAWNGGVSAAVLESHGKDFTPDWRPGSIVRVDAKTGHADVLADGKYVELSLSPDNRYLAAARQGHYMRFRPESGKEVYDGHRLEPHLFDLADPHAPVVSMCDGCQLSGLSEFTWSPGGHRVSYFARFGSDTWDRSRFRIYDADTKTLVEIPHKGLDLASQYEAGITQSSPVKAIPFGDGALEAARPQDDPNAAPIFTFKEPIRNRMYGMQSEAAAKMKRLDWYFVTPDGKSHPVTSALQDVDIATAASDPKGIYFLGGDKVQRVQLDGTVSDAATFGGQGIFYKLDGSVDDGGRAMAIAVGQGDMLLEFFKGTARTNTVHVPMAAGRPAAVDPTSGTAVFLASGASGTAMTSIDERGKLQPVMAINQHLKQVIPAKQVVLKYKLPDGEDAIGCLLLSANAPQKPLPMIVWVYPSMQGGCGPQLWQYGLADTYGQEILTGFGYAVLRPFTPSRLLTDGHNPIANWGALVQPAVDEAVKEGYADKDRLGAWGMSLGGQSVLSLLAETNIFKAGIALNGVADYFSNYASLGLVRSAMSDDLFAIGHSTLFESTPGEGAYIGAPPWDKPVEYAMASPLVTSARMNTPLMLFAGDLDWDYQMTEFDQYFTAMERQGKEAVYVRYWGEGHGNFSPNNVRDAWQRMHAWYETHFH